VERYECAACERTFKNDYDSISDRIGAEEGKKMCPQCDELIQLKKRRIF
jgi:DNA-directed RNA polymerase subunit RPC12/RpoP